MTSEASFAEQNGFGRVGRLPTPTPFAVGDVNAYLVLPGGPDGELTLIDTGVKSPEAYAALESGFRAHGYAIEQVTKILLTHAHTDHYGQAKRLRDRTRAVVHASAIEAEKMRLGQAHSGQRDASVLAAFRRWGVPGSAASADGGMSDVARRLQDPIEVDVIVKEGDRIPCGDLLLEVIETPGHCEQHVVYYERGLRQLFSGDHLLPDISPVPLLVFPKEGEERPKSLVRFLDSLTKVEGLDCALTFPSHGDVIRDHRALIASYRLHAQRRSLKLERLLDAGPATAYELAQRMFPKAYEAQLMLVLSEVIGHLDLLEISGRVVVEERDGVEHVRRAEEAA
jgi:glyoxylase-like metal-dependent hydrolase (beta-lactamase superfamily II)